MSEGWKTQLPQGDSAEQLELFYAHLVLCRWDGDENHLVKHLAQTLLLDDATKDFLLHQGSARLLIYRELTRATHRRVLLAAFPRAAARLGELFDSLFVDFLDQHGTESHFLRDLTPAFLEFCAKTDPRPLAYILELAQLEAIRIQVAAAPNTTTKTELELDLERGLVFSEAARLLHFAYAVHRLPEDEDDRSLPEEKPTHLLSYRDAENTVRYMELSALAAEVVRLLQQGTPLGLAIKSACESLDEALRDQVLAGTAQVLANLAERRVILGVSAAQ